MNADKAKQTYEDLKKTFADLDLLAQGSSILSKDAEVHMPAGAEKARVGQRVAIANAMQRLISDPKLADQLNEAEANAALLPQNDQRNLQLMRQWWLHEASLPANLAEEKARLDAEGEGLHVEHYKSGDWSKMKDWYEHSFNVMREVGAAKKDGLGVSSVYEALLDQFSPGMRVATVEKIFSDINKVLPDMIQQAVALQKSRPAPLPLKGPFPVEKQKILCERAITAMQFDFNRGRFGVIKGHPSSGGAPDDTWFTVRCDENDFTSALYAAIHEAGHAVYDQTTPMEWRNQPAGGALGMAIHESQSRIMEVQAGITPEFIGWLSKQAIDVFGHDPSLEADNLRRLIQRTQPTLIRVEADEMTYPMHVILRFELEKAIIEGKMAVAELPEAWDDGMEKRLGIRPQNNAQGCMQDIHWPTGAIGYFPAYTLGDILAAQLFAKAQQQYPDIRKNLANGDFSLLRTWLRDNVHSKGSLLTAEDMILQATGEPLNAKYYLNHFSERYLGKPLGSQPENGFRGPMGFVMG